MAVGGHTITIVGCGPGSADYLAPAARAAVETADVLVGAGRLLDLFAKSQAERIEVTGKISEALDRVEHLPDYRNVAVLVSGDPGLFSLAKLVIARFGRDRCRVVAGISSVQVAFAQIGLDWADARIVSAHMRDPVVDPGLRQADKIAVFCGRQDSLKWIRNVLLNEIGLDRRIFVMEDLTLESERVREVQADDLATLSVSSRTIVLILKEELLT